MARARVSGWADVGRRIAMARERGGFTQRELAERLGLHRTAVTRLELGQRQIDALELARMADALGRPVDWFLTEPPPSIASYRSGLAAGQEVQRLNDELDRVSLDVELLVDVQALAVPAATEQPGVGTLSEAEAGAAAARRALGAGDGPLVDLQASVERLGLLAFSLDLGPSVVDGGYIRTGDVGIALINGSVDAGRRRFNLAHELGHHLLADEYTADFGLGADGDERESLINAFAIHLLMPRSFVSRRWEELGTEVESVRQRLVVLACEYRVSWSAAVAHAHTLGLVSRVDFETLTSRRPTAGDYAELGLRYKEELQPISLAPAFAQAAVRAYRRGVISAQRAAELLRGTVPIDELPPPHEAPLESLVGEFGDLGQP